MLTYRTPVPEKNALQKPNRLALNNNELIQKIYSPVSTKPQMMQPQLKTKNFIQKNIRRAGVSKEKAKRMAPADLIYDASGMPTTRDEHNSPTRAKGLPKNYGPTSIGSAGSMLNKQGATSSLHLLNKKASKKQIKPFKESL